MKRHYRIPLLGRAAAWSLALRGQRKPIPVIGIHDPAVGPAFDALVQGIHDIGRVEGRNVCAADPAAAHWMGCEMPVWFDSMLAGRSRENGRRRHEIGPLRASIAQLSFQRRRA